MRNHKKCLFLFGLSGFLFMAACSTLSQKECEQGDWYNLGVRDGSSGEPLTRLAKHTDACKEYGVLPNRALYEKGRNEGLRAYCLPENGFALGKMGRSYYNVCPSEMSAGFLKKFRLGSEIHGLETKVSRLYDDILQYQNRLDSERDEWTRRRLREQISDATRERDDAQRRLTVLEVRQDH